MIDPLDVALGEAPAEEAARRMREDRRFREEVERLARAGYRQVTLLGQNVNSYGKRWVVPCLRRSPSVGRRSGHPGGVGDRGRDDDHDVFLVGPNPARPSRTVQDGT